MHEQKKLPRIKKNPISLLKSKLKIFGNEFVHGGYLVSMVAPAISFITMILFNLSLSIVFLVICYLGTYIVYNYDHLREASLDSEGNHERSVHIKKTLQLRYGLLAAHVALFFVLLFLYSSFATVLFGVILLFSGMLYVDVFKKLTKRIIGFKNMYTSLSIALIPVFTLVFYAYQFNWMFLIYFAFIFLQLFLDTSYCDLKDMEDDKMEQLKTLPLYFGKQRFLNLLHLVNLASFMFLVVAILLGVIPSVASLLLVFCAYRVYYLYMAKGGKKDMNFICDVIVDGEYFLWPIVLFIGGNLISLM